MNLYRSFGTLMEAWVIEGGQRSYLEWPGRNDYHPLTPSPHVETHPLSETPDSGVETASSSDMSCPATSCSVSTDRLEVDRFSPGGEVDRLTALHQKVEQALQRTHSENLKRTPVPFAKEKVLKQHSERHTVDERFRRRYKASLDFLRVDNVLQQQSRALSERHTAEERPLRRSRPSAEHLTVDKSLSKQSMAKIERLTSDKALMQHSQASSRHDTVDEGSGRRSPELPEPRTVDGELSGHSPASSERLTVDEVHRQHSSASSEPITVDEKLSQQSQASPDAVTGDDGQWPGLGRTANPLVPMRQLYRPSLTMISDEQTAHTRLEGLGEEEGKGLSPGLSYLEQVCQMLEEIARQQMHNQVLQMEADALRGQQHTRQAPCSCQSDFQGAEDISSCRSLGNDESAERSSNKPSDRGELRRHFRHRSASDPAVNALHLRELNINRGQHRGTDDLRTKLEDGDKKKFEYIESKIKERNKTIKNWTFRIKLLRREESILRDANSQQMQSSERNSARQRLSQLFRRKSHDDGGLFHLNV